MKKISLYGFGGLGKKFYKYAKDNDFEVVNIFDKNKVGEIVDGLKIISPADSSDKDIPVVITILTETVDLDFVKQELLGFGYSNIMNILEAIKEFNILNFDHFFVTHYSLYNKNEVKKKIETVRSLLSDELSVQIFDEIINSRKNADFRKLNQFTQKNNQYLPSFIINELLKLESINVLDLGACYGDLIKSFKTEKINISSYIGFEPDLNNVKQLKTTIKQNNINGLIYPMGAADFNGLVGFNFDHGVSSSINMNSEDSIMVSRIDDIVNFKIDYVKMDIEGFEKEALEGMQNLLFRNKPILAISIYHKPLDFIDIPLSLGGNFHKYSSEYIENLDSILSSMLYKNFFIRYHEKNGYELVLYAF